jgi:DeoR/GlpR family transcriptional regulator of sugar metabolism
MVAPKKNARHEAILQLLATAERLTVAQICTALGASPATARRDLEHLEQQGLVIRTHGGATLRQQNTILKPPYVERLQRNDAEKQAIARLALEWVQDQETIFISSGTTTYHLARLLAQAEREVTVVTNAVDIAMELSRNQRLRLIILGGEVGDSYGISGEFAAEMLQRLPRADKAFVGADGVDLEHGITAYRPTDAAAHKQMAARARETVVLADHSKFGVVRFCSMFPLAQVARIISDASLPTTVVAQFRRAGVEVHLAPVGET